MSVRSTTGCYGCKTMHKKCNEAKPKCLRRGVECQYDYVLPRGGFKIRTRPAPRTASELIRARQVVPKSVSEWTTAPLQSNPTGSVSSGSLGLLKLPLPTSIGIPSPLDAKQHATKTIRSPLPARAQSTSAMATHNSARNQASLYDASLNLGKSNSSLHLSTKSPIFNLTMGGGLDEKLELEAITPILCVTPILDCTVDSNSLAFILQSYAQWMSLTFFDPLSIIHETKQVITDQFTLSLASRSRILLVARLMNALIKNCILDEQGVRLLGSLRGSIVGNIIESNFQCPASDEGRGRAIRALDSTLELMGFQLITSPLSWSINLFTVVAPVFLAACPFPHPPHLLDLFATADINLKHFATGDIVLSTIIGRATVFRYDVPWSLDLCDRLLEKQDTQGVEWLFGIPDQFTMLLAYMNELREKAWRASSYASNGVSGQGNSGFKIEGMIDSEIIEKIQADLTKIRILPRESKEPALKIARMVVQECWRQTTFIYFYMALCGASAQDPRVQGSQKKFMRLVKGIKPSRNPDAFLAMPMIVAGVATTKSKDRHFIVSRVLGVSEYSIPGTMGNDLVKMLCNVWNRTGIEGRPASWDDLSVACQIVTCM